MSRNTNISPSESEPSEDESCACEGAGAGALAASGKGVREAKRHSAKQDFDQGGMHGWRLALVFVGLALGMFVSSLSETIASTALPTIVGDLHGVEIMQWVSTTYILASTVMMPLYGRLGDTIGRKRLLVIAMGIYALGKAICGVAPDMIVLICGRAVSGIGGGGLIILSQAILADVVSARARGKYMGAIGAVFAVSTVLGPVLGGWIVDAMSWRMIFWFTIPLDLIALVGIAFFLPHDARSFGKSRIDALGIACATAFTVSLVLAMSWAGDTFSWGSPQIIGLLTVCALAAAGFIAAERRAEDPVIPLSLFRNRNFILCTITGMLIYGSLDGAINYLPTFIQIVEGQPPAIAGLLMTPMMAGTLISSTASGFIASATGRYKWMLVSMCVGATLGFFLLSTMTAGMSIVLMMLYFFIVGFGIGTGSQILVLVVQNEFPHAIVGTATAANNFFRQIGSTLGTAVVGSVFTLRLTSFLSDKIPAADHISLANLTPSIVDKLPEALRATIASGYCDALIPIFTVFVPILGAATIMMLFVKNHPLSDKVQNKGTSEA